VENLKRKVKDQAGAEGNIRKVKKEKQKQIGDSLVGAIAF